MVGRMQIQADDILYLLDEKWIGRELKAAAAVGLHRKGLEETMHRRFRNTTGLGGLASKRAICSSLMLRGRPGRSSSYSPLRRCPRKRCRHLPTVALVQPKRSAIWLLLWPSADHSTSLARQTRA